MIRLIPLTPLLPCHFTILLNPKSRNYVCIKIASSTEFLETLYAKGLHSIFAHSFLLLVLTLHNLQIFILRLFFLGWHTVVLKNGAMGQLKYRDGEVAEDRPI